MNTRGKPVPPRLLFALEHAEQARERIVELVHHALLHWNNRVVGNANVLWANLGAALGDIAIANAIAIL